MKKNIFTLLSLITIFSVTSCTVEIREDNDAPVVDGGTGTTGTVLEGSGTLTGTITKNTVVKKGNYSLKGIVKVVSGVTLTIEPGANFTASSSEVSGLVILQGGLIKAEGTADQPIVFTSDRKTPGDWNGITLYGDAPILALNGADTAISEDGNAIRYGGKNSNSNSGVMRYIRVEYAGRKIGDGNKESNTFTFYSVGDGTILENLVAYKGTDDGFEFFGGTASAKNLVSYGNYDDSFDWQDAWSGQSNSNWYAFQTGIANFGMEIESSGNINNTAPVIDGITLIRDKNVQTEDPSAPEISAIQFKKQGSGLFKNVYIEGYKDGYNTKAYSVLIQDAATEKEQLDKNKIKVTPINYLNSDNPGVYGYAFATTKPVSFTNGDVKKSQFVSGAWATVDGVDLLAPLKK